MYHTVGYKCVETGQMTVYASSSANVIPNIKMLFESYVSKAYLCIILFEIKQLVELTQNK